MLSVCKEALRGAAAIVVDVLLRCELLLVVMRRRENVTVRALMHAAGPL